MFRGVPDEDAAARIRDRVAAMDLDGGEARDIEHVGDELSEAGRPGNDDGIAPGRNRRLMHELRPGADDVLERVALGHPVDEEIAARPLRVDLVALQAELHHAATSSARRNKSSRENRTELAVTVNRGIR